MYRVHLIDEATIVERGERLRTWFLPLRDSWVRAKDHPGAQLDEVDSEHHPHCPAGTVWKKEIELSLPLHTPLLSRVTTPLVETLEPIEYLTRERRGVRRHVMESWFQVVGNYRLQKIKEPEEFARARKAHRASEKPHDASPGKPRS